MFDLITVISHRQEVDWIRIAKQLTKWTSQPRHIILGLCIMHCTLICDLTFEINKEIDKLAWSSYSEILLRQKIKENIVREFSQWNFAFAKN